MQSAPPSPCIAALRLAAPLVGALLLGAGMATAVQAESLGLYLQPPNISTQNISAKTISTTGNNKAGNGLRIRSRKMAVAPLSLDVSKFVFTAPGRAASGKSETVERSFTFTPSRSAQGKGDSNGLSVGMTTRAIVPPATATASINPDLRPSGYNLDLSLGYRGFAVSGGMGHAEGGLGGREQDMVNVGIGYDSRHWRAGVEATAERGSVNMLPQAGAPEARYSVEARGMFDLSPRISLGGSLRYRAAPPNPTPLDPNRDDRAVMLGGAVTF